MVKRIQSGGGFEWREHHVVDNKNKKQLSKSDLKAKSLVHKLLTHHELQPKPAKLNARVSKHPHNPAKKIDHVSHQMY